jgi:hypothetical protein
MEMQEFVEAITERCAPPAPEGPSGGPAASEPTPPPKDPLYGVERIEKIGGGGFGEVWRVRYLGSEEAWKYIPIRPGMSERTGREAVHARRVNHENVVRVHDVLRLPDHYVLRMELVRGRDFGRVVVEDGIIPPDEAASFGLQVACALACAHKQGIVHLDLKPHNLLLCEDGAKVMVTDFGISASLAPELFEAAEAAGTPYFMAPEQFDDPKVVGPAVDVWSLGVTLYWMMSLSYPFKFNERPAKDVVRSEPPIPLADVAPQVPPALCRIVEGMLQKDPAKRTSSMDDLVRDLEGYLDSPGDPAERAGDRALALCLFDEAIERYREAAHRRGSAAEEKARSKTLLAYAREAKAEHDTQAGRIDERIAGDDFAGALLALGIARKQFSRSASLRARRDAVEKAIGEMFGSPRRLLEGLLRSADFAGARLLLDRVGSLLGVPGARKVLRAVGGEEAVIDGATLGRLRNSVDEKEAFHAKLLASIDEAVQAMDFARARVVIEEVQNAFPHPENLERMKVFSSSAEALAGLIDYPPDLLERLDSDPEKVPISAARPLLLRKAEARCEELLRRFDPNAYPRFSEIAARAAALRSTIEILQRRAEPDLAAIRETHRRGDLAGARRILDASSAVILHTDIFPEEVREEVRSIIGQMEGQSQRADRLYREGRGWLERRGFNNALTAFEEALRIGGTHGDIGFLVRTCTEAAERRRRLSEDLHALDLTISARAVCLAEMGVYLQKSEELLGLTEESKGAETVSRAAAALLVALELASQEAKAASGRGLDALKELAGVVGGAKPEFIAMAAREAPGLSDRLADLIRMVLGGASDDVPAASGQARSPGDPEEILVSLHNLVGRLSPLGPLLAVPPSGDDPHPCEIVAGRVLDLFRTYRHFGQPMGAPMDREILKLLEDLAALAPPPAAARLKLMRKDVLGSIVRRRMVARALTFSSRTLRLAIPIAAAAALTVAGVLAWWTVERRLEVNALEGALLALREDPRWKDVGAILPEPGRDLALTFRMIETDLPAFAAIDGMVDPDARFWARSVSGASVLGLIRSDAAPVLGRSGIRRIVEETIVADLEAVLPSWANGALEPFPRQDPDPGRGFPALLVRLEVAGRILEGLGRDHRPENPSPLQDVRERLADLARWARRLGLLVEEAGRLPAEAEGAGPGDAGRKAEAFWGRFTAARGEAPPDWKRLLDCTAATALARGLREGVSVRPGTGPPASGWAVTGPPASGWAGRPRVPVGPAAFDVLRLIARIREAGGPLPLLEGWSSGNDPLYSILRPVVR